MNHLHLLPSIYNNHKLVSCRDSLVARSCSAEVGLMARLHGSIEVQSRNISVLWLVCATKTQNKNSLALISPQNLLWLIVTSSAVVSITGLSGASHP